ncbi:MULTISPECIES: hypothetical protein [Streptomyces]|uniref:Beta-galactosidase trimerisation domain-containing protein n=1 Tax=Streptomyces griseiscabiei TaxID=2993540 RepID=A0ABU4LFS2_9ACTN|nr:MULTISPECIES: hypothetical protein [Streptomyces]MBZ3900090.1 hypothetical protein [Streptomyces griseiscabiei]MDX2914637.1 hypothetical protein [Streptomyces griseiscabiei]
MNSPARPLISMWFGNFFEPFYSDLEATRRGVADIAALGFNSINLDSKPWEDFFARYGGADASQYVAMQEFMMAEAARLGLDHTCLALYLCGDNLYPSIRSVPPVRGEEAVRADGTPMGTYKYWSPTAQRTMVEHVRGLLKLYGAGMHRTDDGRIVMQTMFDPIAKPSFDAEGRAKYLTWLEARYTGDITRLNERYATDATSFHELTPDEYWLRPAELSWVGCAVPGADDFVRRTPDFHRWVDNQTHLAEVVVEYFATMRQHWDGLDTPLFTEPVLHQWGYFFNPPGQPDWQTGRRALDVYRCAEHVDGVLFMAAPLNAENRADATVVSVEASIARAANGFTPFTGGLYLGRHINADIYRVVPPAEALATHVAAGARGLHVYGYSGLDDGGVLFRADPMFKESLRVGTTWAAEVLPLITEPRARQVALLFPAEMSLYEPVQVDEGGRHRMDLLGWYQQFTDLGWHVDVVHPDQVIAGVLEHYQHLVVPTNSLYDLGENGENGELESTVRAWVTAGGHLWHGPSCDLARRAFALHESDVDFDCLAWADEEIIPHGWSTVAFETGVPVASYLQTGRTAIAETTVGSGRVYSFGFQYGYAYSRESMPIVPPRYGNREMHPVVLLRRTPVEALAGVSPTAVLPPIRGVEAARFGDKVVIVNHRSSPVDLSGINAEHVIAQVPAPAGRLAAHSAVYLELRLPEASAAR